MLRIASLIICLVTLYSCKSAKIDATPDQKQLQKEFAETTRFKVSSIWANPAQTKAMNSLNNTNLIVPGTTASRISIDKGSNYLILNGSEADVYLPYYGERQMGGGYTTGDTGIKYKGTVSNLAVNFVEKRRLYRITFELKKATETYDMTLDLYENLNTRLTVNSSHFTSISYDGSAEKLEEPAMEK